MKLHSISYTISAIRSDIAPSFRKTIVSRIDEYRANADFADIYAENWHSIYASKLY